ncbi:MAG: type I DNA topoisomerase [Patescibacteria group bacterium]|nr:type I DNA topoisomerase [Patescibacteria group bacterium]MDW8279755.1 type I DNA topoisomerase [bacterium]
MKLIIVESPTKAKTISSFLNKDYEIQSSYGHIRDLPKSKLGIDIENNFEPQYIIPQKAKKTVNFLKKLADKSEEIILATDEDREGEAIAWHLSKALNLDDSKTKRIVFHEITKSAIETALQNPRKIDLNLVNAQQARRILDRLVGYKLSPFLWKKITKGLSAGRVQSVALRLIVEREEEIKNFKPEEYWTIQAIFEANQKKFEAELIKKNNIILNKLDIKNENEALEIKKDLEKSSFKILNIETKKINKNPLPPFITSTLQQVASTRLKFSAKKTMFLAQELYERGLITYMRTDSTNISEEALTKTFEWIKNNLPKEYLLSKPNKFKTKSKLAQEAHEAIRPTNPNILSKNINLGKDHQKLYDLIWSRFIASQLPPAIFLNTKIEILGENKENNYTLLSIGSIIEFDGFLKIWQTKTDEKILPKISKNDSINLLNIKTIQHFTEPPPRYTEASLIKILEKYGIGRPSTYAPIISIIQERNYVNKENNKFYPTEIGILVNKVLTENFPQIVDINFTAQIEEKLDLIAENKINWKKTIQEFYEPFEKNLKEKYESVKKESLIAEKTNEICEKCGKPMIIKFGKFGKFLACSGFPECKNTKKIENAIKTNIQCPECLKDEKRSQNPGFLVQRKIKKGKVKGKIFWGCSNYPGCNYVNWQNPEKLNNEE